MARKKPFTHTVQVLDPTDLIPRWENASYHQSQSGADKAASRLEHTGRKRGWRTRVVPYAGNTLWESIKLMGFGPKSDRR